MAGVITWEGDATPTAQVDTFTFASTWAASDTATTSLTAEDGSTIQSVSTIVSSSSLETCRDEHLADLQAETTNALFTKITWASSGTDAITGTAKIAGEPFSATGSETTAGSGTYTRAGTTSSAGPSDWNTAANWSGGAVPTTGKEVKFSTGSVDVLYGLDQSSVALDSMEVGPGYTGSIGQPSSSYYLQIDINNGGGNDALVLGGSGDSYWINGTIPNVQITRSSASTKAIMLDGDIDDLYIVGSGVRGTVDVKSGTVLDRVYMTGSSNAKLVINSSVTSLDTIDMNGGVCENGSAVTAVLVAGGKYTQKGATAVSTIDQWGGTIKYNSSGTITTLKVYNGVFNTEENDSTLGTFTITNSVEVYGGLYQSEGPTKITYSGSPEIKKFGGIVNAKATIFTLSD